MMNPQRPLPLDPNLLPRQSQVWWNVVSSESVPPPALTEVQQLRISDRNSRYLEYKGLPFFGVFFQDLYPNYRTVRPPGLINRTQEQIRNYAKYGNYCVHWMWHFPNSFSSLLDRYLNNDAYWVHVREVCRAAYANDFVLILEPWHAYWIHEAENGRWAYGDMIWDLDHPKMGEDLGPYGLPGKTRRDVHQLAIDRLVEHTWEFPNVVYDFCFEYGIFHYRGLPDRDFSGDLYRWWVDSMKAAGRRKNPRIQHLFSIMAGAEPGYEDWMRYYETGGVALSDRIRPIVEAGRAPPLFDLNEYRTKFRQYPHPYPPSYRHADIMIGEHDNIGFDQEPEKISSVVYNYKVPMLRMASERVFGKEGLNDSEGVPLADIGGPEHTRVIRQIVHGIQTGETYTGVTQTMKEWFLQLRWYAENIHGWENEPNGEELNEARLPKSAPPIRPKLLNPWEWGRGLEVLENGKTVRFAAVYVDPNGRAPAQAEVWVDLNDDGRFDSDPAAGERIPMHPGHEIAGGRWYESDPVPVTINPEEGGFRYTFRFASADWFPPEPGGLIPDNTAGITYNHWITVGPRWAPGQ
jgi:hypothetical protein